MPKSALGTFLVAFGIAFPVASLLADAWGVVVAGIPFVLLGALVLWNHRLVRRPGLDLSPDTEGPVYPGLPGPYGQKIEIEESRR